MLKVERISFPMSVERMSLARRRCVLAIDRKTIFVTDVSKTVRHDKRLTRDASNGIFCFTVFQGLGLSLQHAVLRDRKDLHCRHEGIAIDRNDYANNQEYRERQLDFSHEHRGLRDHHFAVGLGHDAEGVFAMHQLYLDVGLRSTCSDPGRKCRHANAPSCLPRDSDWCANTFAFASQLKADTLNISCKITNKHIAILTDFTQHIRFITDIDCC